jgi:hypothetical protein
VFDSLQGYVEKEIRITVGDWSTPVLATVTMLEGEDEHDIVLRFLDHIINEVTSQESRAAQLYDNI